MMTRRNQQILCTIALFLCFCVRVPAQQAPSSGSHPFLSSALIGNSKVVLLGEPTHGEGNVFEAKTRMVQYLHDSLGFNIIAFESGFYDMYQAQDAIAKHNNTDSKVYIHNALFPIWTGSKEFQPFLGYFEQHKATLRLAGFDCQITGSYGGTQLIDSLLSFIKKSQSRFTADKELLQEAAGTFEEEMKFPEEISYVAFRKEIKSILAQLDQISRTPSLSPEEKQKVLWYRQSALNLAVLGADYYHKRKLKISPESYKAEYSNTRDSMMALNVLALMQLYPGEKIICWGAGTHFMGDPSGVDDAALNRYKPMGMYLKRALGKDQVYNLTFISDKGQHGAWTEEFIAVPAPQPGSIENIAATKGTDHIIDLQSPAFHKQILVSNALEYTPVKADWSKLFNAFVYLDAFTPSTPEHSVAAPVRTTEETNTATIPVHKQHTYTGTIIDATTKQPVPFATVILTSSGLETAANNNGTFSILQNKTASIDSLTAFYYGYQVATVPVTISKETIIELSPLQNTLAEVTIITNKKPLSANELVRKVKENIAQNYGSMPFYEYAFFNTKSTNFDSVILDIDYVGDFYFVDKKNVAKFNLKEIQTNTRNNAQVKANGLNRFYPSFYASWIDVVRDNLLFKNNRYKQYDYKLERSYQDEVMGEVCVISFKARNMAYKFTHDYFTSSMQGEMSIRTDNYAVIEIKYETIRDVERIRKWTDKFYERSKNDPINNWSVLPDKERFRIYCRYAQEEAGGKYYVQQGNYVWFQDGRRKEDGAPVSIISDLSFYQSGKAQIIGDIESVPFPEFQFPKAKPNPAFWSTFNKPKINEYRSGTGKP